MAAWFTDQGPQLVRQDVTTGNILYSMCNSNNTPVFPSSPPMSLDLRHPPLDGTALTGAGYITNGITQVSTAA